MKQNNSNKNFVSSFKFYMIIPMVIVALAIILGAIFGLNFDYDFKNVDTFNVKFYTTITTEEYQVFENEIADIVESYDIKDYRFERIGEGAENGIMVKIPTNENITTSVIDDIKLDIEENLLSNSENITSDVIVATTETITNLPRNIVSPILYALLALGCILLFAFIYKWIRYNLVAAYSLVLTILFEVAMLFAIQVVARIPFNTNFMISYAVMTVATIIITTFINNIIKSTLNDEQFAKSNNTERVSFAISKVLKKTLICSLIFMFAVLILGFVGNISSLYTTISIIVGIIVAFVSSLYFNTCVWALGYKKDKDMMLKRRIEIEKKRLEEKENKNKSDEKIVV